ncbi:MAG: toll/interleukin-1 receptor domain-containing protein [Pseudonocardiaceae bacterium]
MASVFISHRGVDQDAAERLAKELRKRGHVVWLDTWKINLGDSIIEQINDGLSASSYLVLCYSDAGSTSRPRTHPPSHRRSGPDPPPLAPCTGPLRRPRCPRGPRRPRSADHTR